MWVRSSKTVLARGFLSGALLAGSIRSCATSTLGAKPPTLSSSHNMPKAEKETAFSTSDEAAHDDVPTPLPPKKRFTSSPRFKLKDSEVNEDNIPSAAEIREMLPTREELLEQLPTKPEIDTMYGLRNKDAGRAPPLPDWLQNQKRGEASTGEGDSAVKTGVFGRILGFFAFFKDDQQLYVTKALQDAADREAAELAGVDKTKKGPVALHDDPLWPDCDTVDDILKEESLSGGDGSSSIEEEEGKGGDTGEYLILACKALLYGSVMAVVMVSIMSVLVSYFYFGFTSISDMMTFLRGREGREMAALREKALEESRKAGEDDDVEIHQYNIDLTNPTELWEQLTGLMQFLEELAEEQAREDAESFVKPIEENGGIMTPVGGVSSSGSTASSNINHSTSSSSTKPPKKAFVLP